MERGGCVGETSGGGEVHVLLLSARRSAASIATTLMLTAMAAIASVTDAQAAQPNRPGMVQHAMPNRPVMVQHTTPFQQPAPAFPTAPVQPVAPVIPPSA